MTARRSAAVDRAVRMVRKSIASGERIMCSVAAKKCGCHVASVRRALKSEGVEMLPVGPPRKKRVILPAVDN